MSVINEPLELLLRSLMRDKALNEFYLVGGTALAIHLSHRLSVDIDLFQNQAYDSQLISRHLEVTYNATDLIHEENTVRANIEGIKVELLTHDYPLLEDVVTADGIRMASLRDLAAFKLNAIAGRGSKKDFWDLSALMDHYSIETMIGYFQAKYPMDNTWHLIKALSYFDDADEELIEIIDLRGISWQQVKTRILSALRSFYTDQS